MPVNHYVQLGLHADGKNSAGVPYTDDEIKQAYKRGAMQSHPDKTSPGQSRESAEFHVVQGAYDILSDPVKRTEFDRAIANNPGAYLDRKHLFVELDGAATTSVQEDQAAVRSDPSRALVPRVSSGIDLTQLLCDARYDPESLIEIVASNPALGVAIMENPTTFAFFPLGAQFKLLLVVFHQKGRDDATFKSWLFETPTIMHLMEQLTSGTPEFERAFAAACAQSCDWTEAFFSASKDKLASLSKKVLLMLSGSSRIASEILIEQHASKLTLLEFDYVLRKNPAHAGKLWNLYYSYVSNEQGERLKTYLKVRTALERATVSERRQWNLQPENQEMLKSVGLLVVSALRNEYALDPAILFNLFAGEHDVQCFEQKYSLDEKHALRAAVVRMLRISHQEFLSKASEGGRSEKVVAIGNSEIFMHLLEGMTEDDFKCLLDDLALDHLDPDLQKKVVQFILSFGSEGQKKSYFLRLILLEEPSALQCLKRNKQLLVATLKNKRYQETIAKAPKAEQRVAVLPEINAVMDSGSNEPDASNASGEYQSPRVRVRDLSATLIDRWRSAQSLRRKIAETKPVQYESFKGDFEKTGFFEELLRIKSADPRVEYTVAEAYIQQVTQHSDSRERRSGQARVNLLDLFFGGAPGQAPGPRARPYNSKILNLLVTACAKNKVLAQRLFDDISSEISGAVRAREALNSVEDLATSEGGRSIFRPVCFWVLRTLLENEEWRTLYFTAGLADTWNSLFHSSDFIAKVVEPSVLFDGIPPGRRGSVGRRVGIHRRTASGAHHAGVLPAALTQAFREHLASALPDAPVTSFLKLYDFQHFRDRVSLYAALHRHLSELRHVSWSRLDPNRELESLIALLDATGLDEKILQDLTETLRGNCPELLAATLVVLTRDAKVSSSDLQRKVNKSLDEINIPIPLEYTFVRLARLSISSERDRLSGDVLAMMLERHGKGLRDCVAQYCTADLDMITQSHQLVAALKSSDTKNFKHQEQSHAKPSPDILVAQFQEMVQETSSDPSALIDEESMRLRVFRYEVLSHRSSPDVKTSQQLGALVNSMTRSGSSSIIDVVIDMALSGDTFAQAQLGHYMDDSEVKSHLCDRLLTLLGQGQLQCGVLGKTVGVDYVDATFTRFFQTLDVGGEIPLWISAPMISGACERGLTISQVDHICGTENRNRLLAVPPEDQPREITKTTVSSASLGDEKFSNVMAQGKEYCALLPLVEEGMTTLEQLNAMGRGESPLWHACRSLLEDFQHGNLNKSAVSQIIAVLERGLGFKNWNAQRVETAGGNLAESDVNKLLALLIEFFPLDEDTQRLLLDKIYDFVKSKGLTVDQVDVACGVVVRNKVLTYAHGLGGIVRRHNFSFSGGTFADQNYDASSEFKRLIFSSVVEAITKTGLFLLPLVEIGGFNHTIPFTFGRDLDPIERLVYGALIEQLGSGEVAAVRSSAHSVSQFFSSEYYSKFLRISLFSSIDQEINCMRGTHDGKKRVGQLESAKAELHQLIKDHCLKGTRIDNGALTKALHAKLLEIANRPTINKQPNWICSFLKALAGALIAIPLLGIPLAFSQYRSTFFPLVYSSAIKKNCLQYQRELDPW